VPASLRVITFPGVQNLPSFAAEAGGFYERRGLAVETIFTQNSEQQRNGLAEGIYNIAHSAIDNAVSMVDAAGQDVAIVIGLDRGFNKLIAQPEIASYDDLRGKTLGVDAPDTAFALIAYDMLRRKGLNPGDYNVKPIGATRFRLQALQDRSIDVSMLNLPFNLFAQQAGLKVFDNPNDVIDEYQSAGGFVRRAWGEENRDTLVLYLAAYIEGLRWSLRSENREAAIALLAARMDLACDVAEESFNQIADPHHGFTPDARLSHPGMATVLKLRAAYTGAPLDSIPAPDKYLDESYYRTALATLG
jgi:ABC-type nitrate/sulfonate/bicarbonate transport system substrate-binding protein